MVNNKIQNTNSGKLKIMILEKIFGKKKKPEVKINVEHIDTKVKSKIEKETETSWATAKVKDFQRSHELIQDVIIGHRTLGKTQKNPIEEYARNSNLGTVMIDSHKFLERDFLNPIGVSSSTGYTIYTYTGNNGIEDIRSIIDAGYDVTELYSFGGIGQYGTSGSPGYSGSMGTSGTPGLSR
jgi:hypothetical protein